MKILFVLSFFLIFANISAEYEDTDDIEKVLEVIYKLLEDAVKEIDLDPDTGKNINELLSGYNYPLESHNVTTSDGYILTMHRIPYGKNDSWETVKAGTAKPVVFLQHGLQCSSIDWLTIGKESSLALLLADQGYDVWLGNGRGNIYGRAHTKLSPDTDASKFWDFSFTEKGMYDLPASIDYVLKKTGKTNLTYIGHSQGTSAFFAMGSEVQEYNKKINLMVALAPIAYMEHLEGPVSKFLAVYIDQIKVVLDLLGIYEVPSSKLLSLIIQVFCNDKSPIQDVCVFMVDSFVGFDSPQMNTTRLPVLTSNTPAGMSFQEFHHYGQEENSGYFRKYDYGALNFFHYGRLTPPSFKTTKITAPIAAYYGKNDFLAAVVDVERLLGELPNVVQKTLIEYEKFNHLDFIWAKDVKTILYDDVVALVNKYNGIN